MDSSYQSSLMQIVSGTSGCPAENQENLLLSSPGGVMDSCDVPVVWGWCPFPGGDSKSIFLSQMNRKQQNSGFLSIRSCKHRL